MLKNDLARGKRHRIPSPVARWGDRLALALEAQRKLAGGTLGAAPGRPPGTLAPWQGRRNSAAPKPGLTRPCDSNEHSLEKSGGKCGKEQQATASFSVFQDISAYSGPIQENLHAVGAGRAPAKSQMGRKRREEFLNKHGKCSWDVGGRDVFDQKLLMS